jgi:hypothetical protein
VAGKHLSDRALLAEMIRLFGLTHASRLMGWLMVAALNGVEHRDELLSVPFASRTTRWRVLQEVLRLREHLAAIGYEMTTDEVAARIVHAGGAVPAT